MVKFINFKVVGGVEDGAGTLNPGVNGNNLLLIERIIDVDVEIATDGTMQAIFNLTSESGVTTCNVICSGIDSLFLSLLFLLTSIKFNKCKAPLLLLFICCLYFKVISTVSS